MADSRDIIIEKDDVDRRLSTWITRNNKRLNFNSVNTLCRKGLIRINGLKTKASYRLVIGDVISLPNFSLNTFSSRQAPKTDPKLSKLLLDSIIFKDECLIALNKPEGLASQGGTRQGTQHLDAHKSTLQFGKKDPPRLIHRLDKDTSGVLLLARDIKSANVFTKLFREKKVEKIYWALVAGVPKKEEGILESFISKGDIWKPRENNRTIDQRKSEGDKENKKKAQTYYKVIEKMGSQYSWLELRPVTGRTHQLRIHCADLGHQIIGDKKYKSGEEKNPQNPPYGFKKLFLHARCLSFVDPISRKTTKIEAELPEHMDTVWKHFGWQV